ncbi:MAG: hypothetical protein PHE63_06170, partial [Eubacteriales bacterium]|nr:hypothetical protein [Eubacteriales bacterium]
MKGIVDNFKEYKMFERDGDRLIFRYDAETLWIEPWGDNSLRVRSTKKPEMPDRDWALLPVSCESEVSVEIT